MKTINEAAEEWINNPESGVITIADKKIALKAYKAGVEFANKWIPVEDELPEIRKELYEILIKDDESAFSPFWIANCYTPYEILDFFKDNNVTHWRRIEVE